MRLAGLVVLAFSIALYPFCSLRADDPKSSSDAKTPATSFRAGVARRDVTPTAPMPMWGYGARHDMLSQGVLDPLMAKALVIEAGGEKLAIVTLDLGRGPTAAMMTLIRDQTAKRGIRHHLICGSHTHHGPVIELTDQPGCGRGKFDDAVAYSKKLPETIIAAILEADDTLQPARIGVGRVSVALNRNRQSKKPNPPTDNDISVVRVDSASGKPVAVVVNFTAHPVMTDGKIFKFSADYPGFMQQAVEADLGGQCMFIQGASGDQSVKPPEGKNTPRKFGGLIAEHVIQAAKRIETKVPAHPSIQGRVDNFHFASRTNFESALVKAAYSKAFFPELIASMARDLAKGIDPELSTILLNGDLGLVGASGEFFCNHALRLRERAGLPHLLFVGYCNGHHLYFPTIEAAAEGGYGADPPVSPVAVGAGETMMNRALVNLFRFKGKFPAESPEAK